jgi:hypothetical protein
MGEFTVTLNDKLKKKVMKFKGVFGYKSINIALQELIDAGYDASKEKMKKEIDS